MRRPERFALIVTSLVLTVAVAGAESESAEPSFDCHNVAAESTEALICSTPELAALDRELVAWYAEALATVAPAESRTLRARQRGWIKGRNESWKTDDPIEYLRAAYRARIVELGIQAGRYQAPVPVQYDCSAQDVERLIVVAYDTDPPAAVFTMVPDQGQWFAIGATSEAGRHYNTGGFDFQETEQGASVNFAGKIISCTRRG